MRVMWHKQKAVLVAGAAVVGALLVGPAAQASSPVVAIRPVTTSADAGQATPAGTTHQQVTLVTGDVVILTTYPGGRQTAAIVPAHKGGPAGLFHSYNQGHDLYVVPQTAVPYLGSTLDPALFDVTRLARQHSAGIDVKVQLSDANAKVTLPGITLGGGSGRSVDGTLSTSSARAFGLALARQAMRDHAAPTHTTGLFSGIQRISPAASWAASAPTRPSYKMYTLTVKATDWTGAPDNGDSASLFNVDNLAKYTGFLFFTNGVAKVSVPKGHYGGDAIFFDFNNGDIYETTIPQFTVTGNETVSFDARNATSSVTVSTPKPARSEDTLMTIGRADALGQTFSDGIDAGGGGFQFFVQPTSHRVAVGQLYYYVNDVLLSPKKVSAPYTYNVEFPTDGAIPVNQHYVALPGDLATVDASYPAYHDGQSGLKGSFAALPWETFLSASLIPLTTPTQRTEYYSALSDLTWSSNYIQDFSPRHFTLVGELDSSWRTYQPGTRSATSWGGQPAHPRLLEAPLFLNTTVCPACVSDGKIDVLAFPFADNSPEHISYPDAETKGLTETTDWSVSADGLTVKQGSGVFETSAGIPFGAQDLVLSYHTTRESSDFTMSTDVQTTWRVPTDAPEGALPSGWICSLKGSKHCGVLPLMTSTYDLPTDPLGQIGSGARHGTVSIGHLAGSTAVLVRSFTAKMSFDGGTTWSDVKVTDEGSGNYGIDFTVPGKSHTDGFGSLSITARDANGTSFRETIKHAFAVSAS